MKTKDEKEYLLTIQDMMWWFRVSRQTIYDWIEDEALPYHKIRGRRRFRESEVKTWFDNRYEEIK